MGSREAEKSAERGTLTGPSSTMGTPPLESLALIINKEVLCRKCLRCSELLLECLACGPAADPRRPETASLPSCWQGDSGAKFRTKSCSPSLPARMPWHAAPGGRTGVGSRGRLPVNGGTSMRVYGRHLLKWLLDGSACRHSAVTSAQRTGHRSAGSRPRRVPCPRRMWRVRRPDGSLTDIVANRVVACRHPVMAASQQNRASALNRGQWIGKHCPRSIDRPWAWALQAIQWLWAPESLSTGLGPVARIKSCLITDR